ncbi:type VI secretion system protein TssA [Sorangium sp. So ce1000]|uniref:type VI secretion system protein TssA n=1 Tax=Sorangium sp. So ce1000 TaxID=3133325 RepID=UPI003F62228E
MEPRSASSAAPDLPIDVEPLLAPISSDAPAGPSLRYEALYDRIQEARREDDATVPQGIWKTKLKSADWGAVSELGQEALGLSKDLQVAAWLAEAWLQLHGLPGLASGLRLLAGLVERYWDTAHPQMDEGDTATRVMLFSWLDDKLALRLRLFPLTHPEGDERPYALGDWHSAERGKAPSGAAQPSVASQARIMKSVSLTPKPFLAALSAALLQVTEALRALDQALSSRLGQGGTELRKTDQVLEQIGSLLRSILGVGPAPLPRRSEDTPAALAEQEDAGAERAGPIRSRAEAYLRLAEAADYLLRTEPHSPTPYLVKRAVAWGDLPLAKLLEEIVQTPQDLKAIFLLLGIKDAK